jgi:uncharacterized protein
VKGAIVPGMDLVEAMYTEIKPVTQPDIAGILAINNSEIPHVNELSIYGMQDIVAMSYYARIVLQEQSPAGFLIALDAHTSYDSENYRWFQQRHKEFIYIDRIVVHQKFHDLGIGKALYFDLMDHCRKDGHRWICCEVNLLPRNDRSLQFHSSMGFAEIGRFDNPTSGKSVSMLQMAL